MDLLVTPHGFIAVHDQDGGVRTPEVEELAASFQRGRALGLFQLIRRPQAAAAPGGLRFFSAFVGEFMRHVCAHAESEPFFVPLDGFDAARLGAAVPPMVGSEYITPAWLAELFREMVDLFVSQMASEGLSARSFLAQRLPGWETVGLVHFHLAENQQGADCPFAFLATYSVRVADKARVQHRPLAAALGDALRQKEALAAPLMAPLSRAAAASGFVSRFLANKRLFNQLFLTSREAFEFLSQIEAIEQAGIICRVPASWQKGRPARAKLLVTLGSAAGKSCQGFGGMLDFKVGIALGGEELSPEAARELIEGGEQLVLVRGQWVEVDGARLRDLLKRWQAAVGVAEGRGVSFGEAMRMIHGFSCTRDGAAFGGASKREGELCQFVAGPGLEAFSSDVASALSKERLDSILSAHLNASLRPYQHDGVLWMLGLWQKGQGGCLADDMGLGKTIQLIALLLSIKERGDGRKLHAVPPSLLVVPTSLLFNWQAELRRFAPSLRYTVLHPSGRRAAGRADLASAIDPCRTESLDAALVQSDLCITTYGMLMRSQALLSRPWNMVIADEAQNIKNPQTKTSLMLRSLAARARFALTGTPVENSIADLWAIFAFTCPGLLGGAKDFSAEAERLAQSPQGFAPLKSLLAPYLLRRKKSDRSIIADLPDKIEVRADCFLTRRQAQLYQKQVVSLSSDLKGVKDDEARRNGLVLAGLLKLKQICNHPSQAIGDQQYLPADSGKFSRLSEIAEKISARQEKLLIFTQFREITDILAHYLAGIFGRTGCVLHGGIEVDERRQLVERFQSDGGPPFFVLSLRAGGAGLNLTAAAHVIHFDRWWNPAVENQATDRAYRIGQRQNVMVHKFVCPGTIEDKIARMLLAKGDLACDIVDDLPHLQFGRMDDGELMELLALDPAAVQEDKDNDTGEKGDV